MIEKSIRPAVLSFCLTNSASVICPWRTPKSLICLAMHTQKTIFLRIQEKLQQYKTLDLCQGIAAIQVLPRNACHFLRLEFLAGLIVGLPPRSDGPCLSLHRWRLLVRESEVSRTLERKEDPFPNLFTQEVVTPMGTFRVISGPLEGEPFALQMLCEALSFKAEDSGLEDIRDEVVPTLAAGLVLVDRLTERVGLSRGTTDLRSQVDEFHFPDSRSHLKTHEIEESL